MASVGHVKDLPTSKLGVDLEHDFAPQYVTIKGKTQILADIKKKAKEADKVFLAPDPDREGEAIAWHVSQLLGKRKYSRVAFHAITKTAVQKAMAEPRALDQRLVDAQQARRVLDRVVGWLVSPTLRKIGKEARSAGRVQSVALRLVTACQIAWDMLTL
ncbi:MAG: toprim domain-containing protein, partial [Elusimicrobiota bacterium]